MISRLRRPFAILAAPLVTLSLVAYAFAGGGDPASQANELLTQLAQKSATPASPSPSNGGDAGADGASGDAGPPAPTSDPRVVAELPIAEARKALERGKQLRSSGDTARAELADELALEWAQTAMDSVSAVEEERGADQQGKLALDAVNKSERARQLLEEAIARRGRLQAALDVLEKELAEKAVDGGPSDTKGPKKPKGGAK